MAATTLETFTGTYPTGTYPQRCLSKLRGVADASIHHDASPAVVGSQRAKIPAHEGALIRARTGHHQYPTVTRLLKGVTDQRVVLKDVEC